MTSPRLPPELECSIFLLAFQDDHKEAKNLVLVAKRVFDWLIPHVFQVVVLSEYAYLPVKFNEAVYQRHGHHTRHLSLEPSDLGKYLHLFPNVIDLAFWIYEDTYKPYLPTLLKLPLQRISAIASPDLFPVFSKVTHLDLRSQFLAKIETIKPVLYLPNLTHLCVLHISNKTDHELFLDRERCPRLRVMISMYVGYNECAVDTFVQPKVDDERGVVLRYEPVKNWEIGARGGVDMWLTAEGILAERKIRRNRG